MKRALALVLPLSVLVVAACSAGPDGSTESTSALSSDITAGPPHVHLMLTEQAQAEHDARVTEAAPFRGSGRTLTYYGGPVVQNVDVIPVYWNSKVSNQAGITAFYSAVVTGTEMTFLSQYSTTTPKQTIGNGTHGTAHVDSQTSTNVTDAQIQSYLTSAFNGGKLPKPNNNTYYPIHFPSGVKITDGANNTSCVQFCAYHGTGKYNGQDFYYGVLPDLSQSGCAGGCGASTVYNNTTSVASHEFAETITDPAVGLATVYGPPLGWYNATYGEIGDICNGQQTTAVLGDGKSYTVQKLWSNKTSTCATP